MTIPLHMGRPQGSSGGAVGRDSSSGWMVAGANPARLVDEFTAAVIAA
jgi:hypothetical protein